MYYQKNINPETMEMKEALEILNLEKEEEIGILTENLLKEKYSFLYKRNDKESKVGSPYIQSKVVAAKNRICEVKNFNNFEDVS